MTTTTITVEEHTHVPGYGVVYAGTYDVELPMGHPDIDSLNAESLIWDMRVRPSQSTVDWLKAQKLWQSEGAIMEWHMLRADGKTACGRVANGGCIDADRHLGPRAVSCGSCRRTRLWREWEKDYARS